VLTEPLLTSLEGRRPGVGLRWLTGLAIILAACATAPRQPPTDVYWRLTELDGGPVASVGGREPHLRLSADGERVAGFTTCNNFFGRYEAPGGARLRFAQLGSTKMACVDPMLASQEQRFMGALQRVEEFAVVGDTLILLEGKYPLARFLVGQPRQVRPT
jgi:heat shock protein HslJ